MKRTPSSRLCLLALGAVFACHCSLLLPAQEDAAATVAKLRSELESELGSLAKPLEILNAKYRGYLKKQMEAYQQAGQIKGILAIEEEMKHLAAGTDGELSAHPELKRLQEIYREQRAGLTPKRAELRLQLIRDYGRDAAKLAAEWTRAGRIEDAKLALAEAERLAAMEKDSSLAVVTKDSRCFELRVYFATPGKLDQLVARFRDHTVRLFSRHGMESIGYWVPVENPENKLIYILAYPGRDAREASWKAFLADPDWQKARARSETGGRLVERVEATFMQATDYSPRPELSTAGPRVFELRTDTVSAGGLESLNTRFRDHTLALFARHGMTSIAYWNLMPGEKGADTMLVYLLAYPSREAAATANKAFARDPEWIAARNASEEKTGGLTIPKGFKSVFMTATDFSPLR